MRGPSPFQPTEGGANHVRTEPNQIQKSLHRFVSQWWPRKESYSAFFMDELDFVMGLIFVEVVLFGRRPGAFGGY